jgi:hypothetical protein
MIQHNPELVTAKSLGVEVAERDPQIAQLEALSGNAGPLGVAVLRRAE